MALLELRPPTISCTCWSYLGNTHPTTSPPTSTDGCSPSTTTLVSEPEPLSTALPSSSTRRPSATVPVTRLPEERSSRLRPTLSPSTTDPDVFRDAWLLSETPLDT